MNYGLTAVAGITLISLTYYYGKRKLYSYVMDKVKEELDKRMEDEKEFFQTFSKKTSRVKIKHAGKVHSIFVPYDRSKSTSLLRKKVFLLKDEHKIDISQKPGIPYLVSAEDMGGQQIVVEDFSGEVMKRYNGNEIPGYL